MYRERLEGYKKILFSGQQAKRNGIEYFWVDTCRIDNTSSADLNDLRRISSSVCTACKSLRRRWRPIVWVCGTSSPSKDHYLLSIHHIWNEPGTGDDKREVLLANWHSDDGKCYQINDGPISLGSHKAFPTAPIDPQGADLWCQIDLQLPMNIRDYYTLYWVWEWPTIHSRTAPQGRMEDYTSCMDVQILSGISGWAGLIRESISRLMRRPNVQILRHERTKKETFFTEGKVNSVSQTFALRSDDAGTTIKMAWNE
ncbi:hypothetical protein BKA67DRAFT_542728 [Truncatella angustata]|uniref:DUF7492 domain-containing protein n=1 Tax=Truncatella angustata TaxID=152316 RepID=A0A9P8RJI4_9PEZI|nr:uncharacterized protein BKA67DRAFT_542728 [Truncatella angustata]KAH6638627.1 hypothetical protein BKA67DRAFT_542728 [Truncatella angustata]